VVLTTAAQTARVFAPAKKLGQSPDDVTERQVFIGPNLTNAEVRAG